MGYEEGSKKWSLGETGVAEVPSKLNVCAFWSTLYTASLFLSHHCANHCHRSLLAFILVCSACLIKSWNHILCKLRNQIVAYVKMLSLFHLDENRKECVLWLMDTSAIAKKLPKEGVPESLGQPFRVKWHFHRGHLRPWENTYIYSIKITVVK